MQNIGGMISPLQKGEAIQQNGHTVIVKTSGPLPLFGNQRLPIMLYPDSKTALIGTTKVTLKHPLVPVGWRYLKNGRITSIGTFGGAVMTLDDFLMLVNKRDAMLGWHPGTTISRVKVVLNPPA